MTKNSVSFRISGTVPHVIVVFGKRVKLYLQQFFSLFQNSDFSGFSKFIYKCQKEILRCAPPSHVCDFIHKMYPKGSTHAPNRQKRFWQMPNRLRKHENPRQGLLPPSLKKINKFANRDFLELYCDFSKFWICLCVFQSERGLLS